MSVYVDQIVKYRDTAVRGAQTRRNGREWCHMFADTLDELHTFADSLGLKKEWFQPNLNKFPHYDITPSKRRHAVMMGAVETTTKDWIREHQYE